MYLVPVSLSRAEELAGGFSSFKCCRGAAKASAQFENATELSEKEAGCTLRLTNCVSNWVFVRTMGNGIALSSPLKHPKMRKLSDL